MGRLLLPDTTLVICVFLYFSSLTQKDPYTTLYTTNEPEHYSAPLHDLRSNGDGAARLMPAYTVGMRRFSFARFTRRYY